jgi:hypothetical protein
VSGLAPLALIAPTAAVDRATGPMYLGQATGSTSDRHDLPYALLPKLRSRSKRKALQCKGLFASRAGGGAANSLIPLGSARRWSLCIRHLVTGTASYFLPSLHNAGWTNWQLHGLRDQ